jgi:nitroreductase
MNTIEAISSNVAVRDFRPELIPNGQLKRILEAGCQTQSAKNLQPWTFVVIRDRSMLTKLANLMKGDVDETILNNSPMAVAIIGDPASEFYLFDLGRTAQDLTLAAWELGIGSVIISGPEPPDRDEYRKKAGVLLGVPSNLEFRELIVLGYPKKQRKTGRKNRKEFRDIVFAERFGNPI